MELERVKENVVQLESSLVVKQNEILFLEEEVQNLRLKLAKKDSELLKQGRELNKLRVIPFVSYLNLWILVNQLFSIQFPECFATSF